MKGAQHHNRHSYRSLHPASISKGFRHLAVLPALSPAINNALSIVLLPWQVIAQFLTRSQRPLVSSSSCALRGAFPTTSKTSKDLADEFPAFVDMSSVCLVALVLHE